MIGGIGEVCQSMEGFAAIPAVLVNPGVSVSTAAVFGELGAALLPDDYACEPLASPDLSTPAAIFELFA